MSLLLLLLVSALFVAPVSGYIDPVIKSPLPKLGEIMEPPTIEYLISASPQDDKNDPKAFIKNTKNAPDIIGTSFVSNLHQVAAKNPFEVFGMLNQNRKSRLVENRSYSKNTPYENANIMKPPMLKDLSSPAETIANTFWASLPAGMMTFMGPYLMFPYLVKVMDSFICPTICPTMLDNISNTFGPGVSILYGTFVTLTVSILYQRQQDIQNLASKESSLLAVASRNLLSLFKNDEYLAIKAGQTVADQIMTLTQASRGDELMSIMYNDPYGQMLDLLEKKEDQMLDSEKSYTSLIDHCRETIKELYQVRANRLSDEALALPPHHFFILTALTALILMGYTSQIVIESTMHGVAPNESSLIFGLLCSTYMLFYNFATDLNDPFGGIYQVRRSATASHLLQMKWHIINHPLLKGQVDFTTLEKEQGNEDVIVYTPFLNEMWEYNGAKIS